MKTFVTAVIGCGAISDIYLTNLTTRFSGIRVKYCCASHFENAQKKAKQYGLIPATYEQILADCEVELVVVLTPAPTHYELIRQALMAGKHVYTEKTMTVELQQARELVELARSKGLLLGSAPDTFLGAALQKANAEIWEGLLGQITGFDVYANRSLDRMTCLYPFLRLPGGGICYDYGVYHLTALVHLLGPVKEVYAVVENSKPLRTGAVEGTADFGKTYAYENEAQVTAILRMANGVTGTLTLNGESISQDLRHFRIYGETGVLELPDPNGFGGDVTLIRSRSDRQVLENDLPYSDNSRGLGVWDMCCAIDMGQKHRANADLALHVLEVIHAIMESGRKGCSISCES
jgi:predicted dehydrogenase